MKEKELTAEDAIREVFGDNPCPTAPKVVEYGWIKEKDIAYELSEGREDGAEWVGYRHRERIDVRTVTVVFKDTDIKGTDKWKRLHDACQTFWGYDPTVDVGEQARKHIDKIIEDYS